MLYKAFLLWRDNFIMSNEIELIIKLSADEEDRFTKFIISNRNKLISPPKETARKATENHREQVIGLINNGQISDAIIMLRQLAYDEFLREESIFNTFILSNISDKFDFPKATLELLSKNLYNLNLTNLTDFQLYCKDFFGSYAGAISPYIYQLCLSNTQSRRSRAGKVFEGIIYFLYDYYGYSYSSQATIGRRIFTNLGLGKVVDSILPSVDAFNSRRDKTIVGSMKTTLRERWQEVVEEVTRSNLPNIHLLTVDDDISQTKAEQMAKHNIVLVVPKLVKQQKHLCDRRSIIDFETYFLEEIPVIMGYWAEG